MYVSRYTLCIWMFCICTDVCRLYATWYGVNFFTGEGRAVRNMHAHLFVCLCKHVCRMKVRSTVHVATTHEACLYVAVCDFVPTVF